MLPVVSFIIILSLIHISIGRILGSEFIKNNLTELTEATHIETQFITTLYSKGLITEHEQYTLSDNTTPHDLRTFKLYTRILHKWNEKQFETFKAALEQTGNKRAMKILCTMGCKQPRQIQMILMCKFGEKCTSKFCERNHPKREACSKGDECFYTFCTANHPTIVCKYRDCKRKDDKENPCPYRHQTSVESLVRSESPKYTSNDNLQFKEGDVKDNFDLDDILTYSVPLTRRGLQEFVSKYEVQCRQHNFTDRDLKIHLPKTMREQVTQRWFKQHRGLIHGNTISWQTFKERFVAGCPVDIPYSSGIQNCEDNNNFRGRVPQNEARRHVHQMYPGFRNPPRCYKCDELGHVQSNCTNLGKKPVRFYVRLFERKSTKMN